MIAYQAIVDAYLKIEDYLLRQEAEDLGNRDKWSLNRSLNDYAYFLMLFAQLEQHINQRATALIKKKKAMKNHELAWDIIATKGFEDKYPFNNRVALLLGTGSHVAKEIIEYYEIRCKIAHGNISGLPLSGSVGDFAVRIRELANIIGKQGGTE